MSAHSQDDDAHSANGGAPRVWQVMTQAPDLLGESPFWHPGEQMLYWVDIPGRQLRRARGEEKAQAESWSMPSEPGCIAPALGGGLVIALRDGVYRAPSWGAELALIQRFDHDPSTTRFNDGKADPLGRFWAGTMYEPRTARGGKLYSLDCRPENGDGGKPRCELKADDNVIANGLAWSPDQRTVYWASTSDHLIRAWDWDAQSNAMDNPRVFRQFDGKPEGWKPGHPGYGGRPDGAAVDSQGNYWCAMFEGARLCKLSPAGELLEEIPLPAASPTMPCFGGADMKTLFVTSALDARPREQGQAPPHSGHVLFTRVEVAGLPVNFFSD